MEAGGLLPGDERTEKPNKGWWVNPEISHGRMLYHPLIGGWMGGAHPKLMMELWPWWGCPEALWPVRMSPRSENNSWCRQSGEKYSGFSPLPSLQLSAISQNPKAKEAERTRPTDTAWDEQGWECTGSRDNARCRAKGDKAERVSGSSGVAHFLASNYQYKTSLSPSFVKIIDKGTF